MILTLVPLHLCKVRTLIYGNLYSIKLIITCSLYVDDSIRSMVTDIQHTYEDPNLHNRQYMSELFMNYICMQGLKYDASRLIKRTWVYFVPG